MVAKALEEDAPAKQRYLQRLYVDIDAVCSPGIGAYDVGDEGAEQAIEVGEEEDGAGESVEEEHQEERTARRRESALSGEAS